MTSHVIGLVTTMKRRVNSDVTLLTLSVLVDCFGWRLLSASSAPNVVYVTVGMSGRISCPFDPQPPSRLVLWMKEGHVIDVTLSDERMSIDSDGDLVIDDVINSDEGRYVCMTYSPLEKGHVSTAYDVIVKGKKTKWRQLMSSLSPPTPPPSVCLSLCMSACLSACLVSICVVDQTAVLYTCTTVVEIKG